MVIKSAKHLISCEWKELHGYIFDMIRLNKARLSGWNVTPFLNNWFVDLSGIGSRSRTGLLRNIDTLFPWLQKWYKLSDMFAALLRLQVTVFLWYL